MFFALKEMKDAKLRFGLLLGFFLFISLIVFMALGLGTGLSNGQKKAVANWPATGVVLNENANKLVNASFLSAGDLKQVTAEKKAAVGFYTGALTLDPKHSTKDDVSVFGVTKDSFILPKILKGHVFQDNYQILISKNLATQQNLKIGDQVKVGNLLTKLTITGIIPATTYSMEPVIYTNLATYQALKFGSLPKSEEEVSVNALVFVAKDLSKVLLTQTKQTTLEKMSLTSFIRNLPNYQANKIIFSLVIGLLIFIAAIVSAIFWWLLTLRKKALLSSLKIQGIPVSLMTTSILVQSFFLSLIGSLSGLLLALFFSQFLPSSLPFLVAINTWSLYILLLVGVEVLGGVISFPLIWKIDPMKAIGE